MLDYNVLISNLVGTATDGAIMCHGWREDGFDKNIQGRMSMVTGKSSLRLSDERAANAVSYIDQYIGILNQFAKVLKFSHKLCKILSNCKEMHEETACKIKQVFFTQWLSCEKKSMHTLCG